MKLIDLLVQELPKRGGWPDGAIKMSQDYDGELWYWRGHDYDQVSIFARVSKIADNHRKQGKYEDSSCFVTREQYEAALAALQQPVWGGDGLPPVGCECECKFNNQGDEYWGKVKILWTDGSDILCEHTGGHYPGTLRKFYQGALAHMTFRPLRTEAERKRDDAKKAISELRDRDGYKLAACMIDPIYDAIAAGKIPHIKLSD